MALAAWLVAGAVFLPIMLAAPVLAHGIAPTPGSLVDVLLAWSLEAHVVLPLLGAALLYRWAVGPVRRAHPANPVPRFRSLAWYGGLLVIFIALESPIGTYDTTLFSVHMVQHLLLTLVAAPLLALGAPITLLLRVSSSSTRRRIILPILHSRVLRVISFPVVTWLVFAGVMWGSHSRLVRRVARQRGDPRLRTRSLPGGRLALLVAGRWGRSIALAPATPSPNRLPVPGHAAIVIPRAGHLLGARGSLPALRHPRPTVGPVPLDDQQIAGGIMWAGGDMAFLIALILAVWVWLKAEESEGRRSDARLDRETARLDREAAAPSTARPPPPPLQPPPRPLTAAAPTATADAPDR